MDVNERQIALSVLENLREDLTFAAGVGVGLGVGMLTPPASGEDSHSALAGKVREVGDRVKKRVSGESGLSGT